jgi:hypothetical protein
MKHLPILFYLGRGKWQVFTLVGSQISTCQSPKVAGVALDVIGRWLVRLFILTTLVDFSYSIWKAVSATLGVFLLRIELYITPGKAESSTHVA